MRLLQKLFPLEMNENEIRSSSNPRMKKIGTLSKKIQEDEKKEDNDVNDDELFPKSTKKPEKN